MKTILRILLIAFLLFAGSYHFINPSFYYDQIPPYFSNTKFINYTAGIVEILLAIGIVFKRTRFLSTIGVIILMLAFVPTHWLVIQKDGCIPTAYCVPLWLAWVRLLILQPLFILWAWFVRD